MNLIVEKIEEMGDKWTTMENYVHNFMNEKSDNKDTRSQKIKNQTISHNESTHLKKIVIDVIYLSYFVSTIHRYLVTMVDHFS